MWCISLCSELAKIITLKNFSSFIERIIANRREQIKAITPATNMLFYIWFDEQASQLRFNIISNDGTGLPFKCKVILIDDYTPILKAFLEYPYHGGIPIIADTNLSKHYESEYAIKVYCTGV